MRPRLICLREAGPLADDFRAAGVPVEVLHRTGGPTCARLLGLARALRADRTDVVLVTHHNRAALTLGRLAARLAGVPANVVAAHDMDLTRVGGRVLPRHDVDTLFLSDALVLLAPSQGDYLHEQEGVGRFPWRRTREVVIGNGIVVGPPPTAQDRAAARASGSGWPRPTPCSASWPGSARRRRTRCCSRPSRRLAPTRPDLRLVVVGGGRARNPRCAPWSSSSGIAANVLFTGIRDDVPQLLPGFDVSCLSSVHEGVPLAVLESMAAGVPVVGDRLRGAARHGRRRGRGPAGPGRRRPPALADRAGRAGRRPAAAGRAWDAGPGRGPSGRAPSRTPSAGYQRLLTELAGRR